MQFVGKLPLHNNFFCSSSSITSQQQFLMLTHSTHFLIRIPNFSLASIFLTCFVLSLRIFLNYSGIIAFLSVISV